MPRIGLVFLSLCLMGCATSSDDSSSSDSSSRDLQRASESEVAQAVDTHNEQVTDAKDKVICTRETVVGTHFSRRVCRTVRQIEEDRAEARRSFEDTQPGSVGSDG